MELAPGHLRILPTLFLVTMITVACTLPWAPTEAPLRNLAAQHSLSVGVAVDVDALTADPDYRALVGREFSMVTPENVMKFDTIHPGRNQYDFTQADALVAFAAEQGMAVHGHVLLWHQQLPEWLTRGKFSREELKAILRDHILTVVGHYRGRIAVWDVASEVVGDDGKLLDTFWSRGIGPDYLRLAFTWAHEADSKARLLYNEYGAEGLGLKSDAVYQLVTSLRKQDVPIDGVGLQMHVTLDDVPAPQDVAGNIERLARAGLEADMTEMDVAIKKPVTPDKLAKQAHIYADMLRVCLAAPACKSFSVWGAADRYSWVPGHFPAYEAPLLFDRDSLPKPAYRALLEVLRQH